MSQTIRAAKLFGDKEDPRKRLSALFGGEIPQSGQPPAPALEWALSVFQGKSDGSNVNVIATLRRAEPVVPLKVV